MLAVSNLDPPINILLYFIDVFKRQFCFCQLVWSKSFMMRRLYIRFSAAMTDRVHHLCSSHTLSNSFNACWSFLGFCCCFSVSAQVLPAAPASDCISAWVLKVHPPELLTCLSLKSQDLFMKRETRKYHDALWGRSGCLFSLLYFSCELWHWQHLHSAANLKLDFCMC